MRFVSPRSLTSLALAAAFAMSASGARAKDEIVTQAVEYQHGDVVLEGWLARPSEGSGKRPGVLVVHAWKGLDAHAKESAEKLARMGYVAFALDMYGKGVRPQTSQEAGAEAGKYKKDRALTRARAQAGLDRLKQEATVDGSRVGAIGYCFGGMVVLELARSGADVAAVVSFHGALDTPTPDDMKSTKSKVLVLHGADDPNVTQEHVAALVKELQAAKADWSLVQYGGAVHAFTDKALVGDKASPGARYDENADKRSWQAMSALFAETLSAGR